MQSAECCRTIDHDLENTGTAALDAIRFFTTVAEAKMREALADPRKLLRIIVAFLRSLGTYFLVALKLRIRDPYPLVDLLHQVDHSICSNHSS